MAGDLEEAREENVVGSSLSTAPRSSTVSSAKFEVEKFNGTNNFGMWQCEVKDVLIQQDLDLVLEDKPANMEQKVWDRLNLQACGTIRLFLAKDQKYSVMKETKAKVLWKLLEDKFMTKSVENRLFLKKKLFRFQYQPGCTMQEHLTEYNKILADLRNLDVDILDEDKALLLLNSLPDEYDHLITTLLYGKEEIKVDVVASALIGNEYRRRDKMVHRDTAVAEAMYARGKSKKKGASQTSQIDRDTCAYCHKKGHWKKDCPNLQKGADKEIANANVNVATQEDEFEFALVGLSSDIHSEKWILDTGASYHMCPNRDMFSSLSELDGSDVLMGDGHTCETRGIGSIDLVLQDGSTFVLSEVRYVPSLGLNLISLGALESTGLWIVLRGGALEVLSGNQVVMRGTRYKNLYYLEGSTTAGGVSTIENEDHGSVRVTVSYVRVAGIGGKQGLGPAYLSFD